MFHHPPTDLTEQRGFRTITQAQSEVPLQEMDILLRVACNYAWKRLYRLEGSMEVSGIPLNRPIREQLNQNNFGGTQLDWRNGDTITKTWIVICCTIKQLEATLIKHSLKMRRGGGDFRLKHE